jgi:toxin ParE1/3/4
VRVKWTRTASHDLNFVADYIGRDNPGAAVETVLKIVRQVGILAEHPGMGRPGRVEDTRELVVTGLPYAVPYIHERDTVTVLRVLHGAMKWPRRL